MLRLQEALCFSDTLALGIRFYPRIRFANQAKKAVALASESSPTNGPG
jgi:hypothetical protein